MKLFVAGEGPDEIGKWPEHPSYRAVSRRGDGVLATLFRKRHEASVIGGTAWKNARQFRAGVARGDVHALEAHALSASEAEAEALVWARDTDGDDERVKELRAKQEELRLEFPALTLVGGLPNPALEAWVIAIGQFDAHPESRSKARLKELAEKHDCASESKMSQLISDQPLTGQEPAPSLREFVAQLDRIGQR